MLEAAARRYGARMRVRWHAYELRPEPVPQPDPGSDYILEHWRNRVLPMAAERGLTMRVPRRKVRSRRALQAALFAQEHGQFAALDAALFKARFEDDADISDIEVLEPLARGAGLDDEAMAYAVTTNAYVEALQADVTLAYQLRINGVPAMMVGADTDDFDQFLASAEPVLGAVPSDWLEEAIERALRGDPGHARVRRHPTSGS